VVNVDKLIEQYYAENFDKMCKRLVGRVGSMYTAEDCVQEAFSRALKYKRGYDPKKFPLPGWIGTILNNVVRDAKRDLALRGITVPAIDCDNEEVCLQYEQDFTTSQVRSLVQEMMGKQPEDRREILSLYYIKDFKLFEIAQITGLCREFIRKAVLKFQQEVVATYGEGECML
jgi:RNA polymerase sigma factor (sigma-70 family)